MSGVDKAELGGMERLSLDEREVFMFTPLVEGVADDRPVARCQMDADLMCPSGEQATGEQACDFIFRMTEALTQAEFGDSRFAAIFAHGHFAPLDRMTTDGRIDAFRSGRRPAPDEREIFACEFAVLSVRGELLRKAVMSEIGFSCDDQSTCIHIESMDDAWALLAADAGKIFTAMMEQRIDERIILMAARRMNWQSGGFVDDDEIVIFVDDIEVDLLGRDRTGFRRRQSDREDISGGDFAAGIVEGEVLPPDAAGFDQSGDSRAAEALIGQGGGQSAGKE